ESVVVWRHMLKNALIPLITLLGLSLPDLFGGAFIVENLFAIPGIGRLSVESVFRRDYTVVMGVNMIAATLVVLGNLIADILYAVVDPRVKYS
ncbi:MAG: ABC transporter permease, partial [Clostridia bacterium]|nr:ABC transporter permease [Clostridia bacterium]